MFVTIHVKSRALKIIFLAVSASLAILAVTGFVLLFAVGTDTVVDPYADVLSIALGSASTDCVQKKCVSEPVKRTGAGKPLIFMNPDDVAHTMTSGTPETGPDDIFDSGIVPAGQLYTLHVQDKGTYDWYCLIHPRITGRIIVG